MPSLKGFTVSTYSRTLSLASARSSNNGSVSNHHNVQEFAAQFFDIAKARPTISFQQIHNYPEYLHRLTMSPYLPKDAPIRLQDGYRLPGQRPEFLPYLHHFIYFSQYAVPENELSPDGTDFTFNPGPPFTRRMFAGGKLEWSEQGNIPLEARLCEKAEIESVETRRRGNGEDMLVVSVRKSMSLALEEDSEATGAFSSSSQISNDSEGTAPLMVERRQWVFLREKDSDEAQTKEPAPKSATPSSRPLDLPSPDISHTTMLTRIALFRYSALLFAAHRIHIDPNYATQVEGHPDLLVQGPFTFTLMLEVFKTALYRAGHRQMRVKKMEWRAVQRLMVEETVTFCANLEQGLMWAEKKDQLGNRQLVMRASIELYPDLLEEEIQHRGKDYLYGLLKPE